MNIKNIVIRALLLKVLPWIMGIALLLIAAWYLFIHAIVAQSRIW